MGKTITELRNKWLPILQVRQTISEEELEEYNKEVKKFVEQNPNWEDNIVYI